MSIYYRIEETVGSYFIVWDNMFTSYENAQSYIDRLCEYPNHRSSFSRKFLRIVKYSSNGWKPIRIT